MIIQIALFIILAIVNGLIDGRLINSGKNIDHTSSAIIRGILLGMISLLNFKVFILGASIFWIIFEIVLNLTRKKPVLYVGFTSKLDKLTRTIFPKNTGVYYLLVKILVLVLSIIGVLI